MDVLKYYLFWHYLFVFQINYKISQRRHLCCILEHGHACRIAGITTFSHFNSICVGKFSRKRNEKMQTRYIKKNIFQFHYWMF